ncbi:unnamed protein product [Thlaspi arvense]|uniref:PGG domain-containing protein n=1 Tax=Thlaspi arvense TaxID=13288 RepID=A0AAU9SKJ4_THLAR|nr:unnamed protein product [Thlaspi arvense]
MPLNRNIQNKKGMTALDVLRSNGSDMSKDTEKTLQNAGGKTKDSLSKVKTMSAFPRIPLSFWEYCSTGMARYRSRMSDGTRNALLVITALIITTTYQTAVQPDEDDTENPEYITYSEYMKAKISKIVILCGFNSTAFCLAIALTFILLPVGKAYKWWYICITLPLVCSYALSIYLKCDFRWTVISTSLVNVYFVFILRLLVYVLVFYVRWKRTMQKNVPEPKTELLSEDFKTMV